MFLCVLTFDPKKLDAAIQLGDVDPVVVAKHASVKARAPYVRRTVK